ncbi:hypothetical protein [Simkania sp.]|uniref:hypothetical protein n=1 Tax=Simkania sp. TaxID=34094 RepID=UPI003B5259B3
MLQVELTQALKTHQFNLRELQEARQAKMEQVAMEVAQYLIHSFGLRFAIPIATYLKEYKSRAKVSLAEVYVSYYKKLSKIQNSLREGHLPPPSPFGSKRSILSVETPEALRNRNIHFLLLNLPAPQLEVPELPCAAIKPAQYVALEEPHAALKASLFHILSLKPDPPEATNELLLFVTRCDAMRGISWAYLIKEWAEKTNQREKASALLAKHALAPLVKVMEFTPDYKLPDPLDLPIGCSFQEYVCERTLNLIEAILQHRLPSRFRHQLLVKFMENEELRMRVAFALCPPDKFNMRDLSRDLIENSILRDLRIALNLLSCSPSNSEEILNWIFFRNRTMEDVGGLDQSDFRSDSRTLSGALANVKSLKILYPQIGAASCSTSPRTFNGEDFEEHAFFLLANFLHAPRLLDAIIFLNACSDSPQMQVSTRQILAFVKKHRDGNQYEKERFLIKEISQHFEAFRMTPSPLFFDFVINCPLEIEEVRLRLNHLLTGLPFDPKVPLDGEAPFVALHACVQNSQDDVVFAVKLLEKSRIYRLSINQELHLFAVMAASKTTPEGDTGLSERNCFAGILNFMKRLDLFFGRPVTSENAFQLLFFHPNMKLHKKVPKHLTLLAGMRSELELVDQMILPTATQQAISNMTGQLIFPAPNGLLPCSDEYKTRPHIGSVEKNELLKVTVMQLASQINFPLLGVAVGAGDKDVPGIPLFQSFFPKKIDDSGVVVQPPSAFTYTSLEDAPFDLPHTFFYGEWQLISGRSFFLGTLIFEGSGKTVSLEVPLRVPIEVLVREKEDFFKLLSVLYLETCNEYYCGLRAYKDEPIEKLEDLLEFYADAKQAWSDYEPKEGSKADLAPAIFAFLKRMRMQTRQAMRVLSTHHILPCSATTFTAMAAACTLYPNEHLKCLSLLPPNIPLKFHAGFCINNSIDKPLEHFERTRTPITDFTTVGELLVTDEKDLLKIPLKMIFVQIDHYMMVGFKAGGAEMIVRFPKLKFAPHHVAWQLLMLKGRFYRMVALS